MHIWLVGLKSCVDVPVPGTSATKELRLKVANETIYAHDLPIYLHWKAPNLCVRYDTHHLS